MSGHKKRNALLMIILTFVPYLLPESSIISLPAAPVSATPQTSLGIWSASYNSSAVANSSIATGTIVQLRVNASGGTTLNGFDITVSWDPLVLNGTDVTEQGGIFATGFFQVTKEIATDHVRLAGVSFSSVVGTGTVFFFKVKVLTTGSTGLFIPPHLPSPLPQGYTSISGGSVNNLPYETLDGYYSNDSTKSDLVLASTHVPSETVTLGDPLNIIVTVKNAGSIPLADITISVYANNTLINSANIALLAPASWQSETILWNTVGFSAGTYNVTSTATTNSPDAFVGDNRQSLEQVRLVIHDLRIDGVTTNFQSVKVNTTNARINVTIANLGTIRDLANVTVYANNTRINSIICQPTCTDKAPGPGDVDPGTPQDFVFPWNTSAVPLGYYNLTAEVSPVPGETNLSDNTFTYGIVAIVVNFAHDLEVTGSFPAENIKQGDNATFTFTLKNNGVSNENYVFMTVLTNQTAGFAVVLNQTSGTIPALQQIPLIVKWKTKNFTPGTYHGVSNVSLPVDENPLSNQKTGNVALGPNTPLPVASFTFTPPNPQSGTNVSFNASASEDPDGIHYFIWDFGDGTTVTATTSSSSHTYTSSGTFTVTLTVWDKYGAQGSIRKNVTVAMAPQVPLVLYIAIGAIAAAAAAGALAFVVRKRKKAKPTQR